MVRTVKDPETRRAEIVETARRLFQSRTYDQTSMQDVMQELEIAKGTIYYYFKSKEELLDAVIENMADEALGQMQNILDNASGNALERLQLLIAAGRIADENPAVMDQLHNPRNAGMHAAMLAVAVKKTAPLYAEIIRQGNREDLFQVENPLETAEMILTTIQFLLDTGIYQWTPDDMMRRAIALPGLIETLVKAKPGSLSFLLEKGNK